MSVRREFKRAFKAAFEQAVRARTEPQPVTVAAHQSVLGTIARLNATIADTRTALRATRILIRFQPKGRVH